MVGWEKFRDGSPAGGNYGHSCGHCFDDYETEALGVVIRGKAKAVAIAEQGSLFFSGDKTCVIHNSCKVGLAETGVKFALITGVDECSGDGEVDGNGRAFFAQRGVG